VNRWILSRLADAVEASTRGIDEYRLDEGSGALYHFFWDEFCAWFVRWRNPSSCTVPTQKRPKLG